MIPVQTIVPAALAAIVRKAPLTNEKVGFAWRTAVGAAVAGATDVLLDGTTLRVRTRDRAWQREIERSAATIRTRLEDLLGPGVVRYLDVTVAAAEEPWPPAAAPRRATGPAAAGSAPKNPPSAGGSDNARRRR